jgi:hypothetical protein
MYIRHAARQCPGQAHGWQICLSLCALVPSAAVRPRTLHSTSGQAGEPLPVENRGNSGLFSRRSIPAHGDTIAPLNLLHGGMDGNSGARPSFRVAAAP